MARLELRDRWVLVTGASAGLGASMARVLAREHGANLVLVARRRQRLDALAEELSRAHGVQAHGLVADLALPADVERIFPEATAGRAIDGVVLNAGVTHFGNAMEQSHEAFHAMVATNVTSLVRLATQFVPHLAERPGKGALMLVSSLAGFVPMPFQAAYGGTKAFVTSFGQALAQEVAPLGVSVTVFAPGGIATEMLESSGLARTFKPGSLGVMDAELCARLALDAFVARKGLYVPGVLNKLSALVVQLLPRALVVPQVAATYRKAL